MRTVAHMKQPACVPGEAPPMKNRLIKKHRRRAYAKQVEAFEAPPKAANKVLRINSMCVNQIQVVLSQICQLPALIVGEPKLVTGVFRLWTEQISMWTNLQEKQRQGMGAM